MFYQETGILYLKVAKILRWYWKVKKMMLRHFKMGMNSAQAIALQS